MLDSTTISLMTKPKPHIREYMLHKSTAQESVIPKSIPVYMSLHNTLKRAAEDHNIPLYEVYAQASRLYLQNMNYFVPEIGEVTPDEKTFVEDSLNIYRNRNSNKVFGEFVTMVQSMIRLLKKTNV